MSVEVTIYANSERSFKKERFKLTLDTIEKAYSFCQNTSTNGYWRQKDEDEVEYYPPYTIQKILIKGTGVDKGRGDEDIT